MCFNYIDFDESSALEGEIVTSVSYFGLGAAPLGVRGSFSSSLYGSRETVAAGSYGALDSGSTDGDWQFTSTSALTCSTESCGMGVWGVELYPSDSLVAGRTLGEWCHEMTPTCISIESKLPDSEVEPTEASCVAGAGRFQLVPIEAADLNGDGMARTTYLPAQVSGSGSLTNAASVTQVSLVDDSGYPLRVLKRAAEAQFLVNDTLQSPASVSTLLTGQHSFAASPLRGMPKFLHPPMLLGTLVDAQVDLTWSCGAADTVVTPDQGYSLALSAMGCPAIQRVTMRPGDTSVRLEFYGNASYALTTNLAADGSFSFNRDGLAVSGKVLSAGANGASVQLLSATFDGVSQCTPGTYTWPPES